jgi:hypothetical protein
MACTFNIPEMKTARAAPEKERPNNAAVKPLVVA